MILVNNLVIEATRRCNMRCAHCLRGDAESKIMNEEVIKDINKLFKIHDLTISGGEPLSSIKTLNYIADWLQYDTLYMVTNGTKFSNKIKDVLKRLYYNNIEECSLNISIDKYHTKATKYDKIIRFCEYEGIPICDKKLNSIIDIGNALDNGLGNRHHKRYKIDYYRFRKKYVIQDLLYVNVYGDIYPDCDLSYRAMRENKHLCLGNVKDDENTIMSNIRKYNKEELYKQLKL